MHVVLFEGAPSSAQLAPVSLSRPNFSLMVGTSTLLEKQLRFLKPDRLTLWVRPQMEAYCRARILPSLKIPTQVNAPLDDEPALIVSSRTMFFSSYEAELLNHVVIDQDQFVREAFVQSPGLAPSDVVNRTPKWLGLLELPQSMPQARWVNHLWDLLNWNEECLMSDSIHWREQAAALSLPTGQYHVVGDEDVLLAEGVQISPGVVLDASQGPVMVDRGASLGANSVLIGPIYIGQYTQVAPLSVIRRGTTIGPACKVGGEISNSIMLGYSNKAHEGFLGDSYLGEWVNLGAGTTTSNLKNTYGEISVRVGDRDVMTGRRLLGSLIGDHSKTGIGTRLGAGSYVGYCCSLAGDSVAPKFVPSLTFWTNKGMEPFQIDKAKQIGARVMSRREQQWTELDTQLLEHIARIAPQVEKSKASDLRS